SRVPPCSIRDFVQGEGALSPVAAFRATRADGIHGHAVAEPCVEMDSSCAHHTWHRILAQHHPSAPPIPPLSVPRVLPRALVSPASYSSRDGFWAVLVAEPGGIRHISPQLLPLPRARVGCNVAPAGGARISGIQPPLLPRLWPPEMWQTRELVLAARACGPNILACRAPDRQFRESMFWDECVAEGDDIWSLAQKQMTFDSVIED
ncbi:hypothetical protein B0H17DRAFT_323677, partial [Mycena rosella]